MSNVTQILSAIEQGDGQASERLLPLVYDELRRLAAEKMAQEAPGQTLQATALVHEAYLRLLGPKNGGHWDGRRHFFAAAAEAMRRILIENARRKKRVKHGGSLRRVELLDAPLTEGETADDLLALDEALEELAATDAQAAELVKLRLFTGLTIEEAAEALGLAPRTAYRNWAYARAWLYRRLADRR